MEVQMHDGIVEDDCITIPVTLNGREIETYGWNLQNDAAIEFINNNPDSLWVVLKKAEFN